MSPEEDDQRGLSEEVVLELKTGWQDGAGLRRSTIGSVQAEAPAHAKALGVGGEGAELAVLEEEFINVARA